MNLFTEITKTMEFIEKEQKTIRKYETDIYNIKYLLEKINNKNSKIKIETDYNHSYIDDEKLLKEVKKFINKKLLKEIEYSQDEIDLTNIVIHNAKIKFGG